MLVEAENGELERDGGPVRGAAPGSGIGMAGGKVAAPVKIDIRTHHAMSGRFQTGNQDSANIAAMSGDEQFHVIPSLRHFAESKASYLRPITPRAEPCRSVYRHSAKILRDRFPFH